MEKGSTFLALVVIIAGGVISLAACGDEEESTFEEGAPDSAVETSPGFVTDSDGGSDAPIGDATPGAKCEPTIPDDYKPTWIAPANKGDAPPCSASAIDEYFAACVASLGQPDAGTACDTWKAANAACAACAEPTNNTGPIQWHQQRFYYTLNVAGCIAIKQGKLTENDCGAAYNAAVQCSREACGGCFQTGTSTFDDFRTCQTEAANVGFCKSLETQQASLCPNVRTEPATAVCFKDNAEQSDVFFKRVIGIFCGP